MTETRNEPVLQRLPSTTELREPDEDQAPRVSSRRRRRMRWLALLLFVLAIAAVVSVLWQPRLPTQLPAFIPRAEAPATKQAEPKYPIEATAAALPSLDASDTAIIAALQTLWDGAGVAPLLESSGIVRNFVATVDNLPRRTLPASRRPLRPPSGTFGATGSGDALKIGDANAARYTPYVRLIASVEPTKLVGVYVRHYPLFQQAYQELGYPEGHFNDRLVEAIDVLLATPEVPQPLRLTQPKVFYEFADRDLESLPSGQKLMLRMGAENAKLVRARLVELRRILTAQTTDVATAPTR